MRSQQQENVVHKNRKRRTTQQDLWIWIKLIWTHSHSGTGVSLAKHSHSSNTHSPYKDQHGKLHLWFVRSTPGNISMCLSCECSVLIISHVCFVLSKKYRVRLCRAGISRTSNSATIFVLMFSSRLSLIKFIMPHKHLLVYSCPVFYSSSLSSCLFCKLLNFFFKHTPLQTRGADVEHGANREHELRLPVRWAVQLCGNQ